MVYHRMAVQNFQRCMGMTMCVCACHGIRYSCAACALFMSTSDCHTPQKLSQKTDSASMHPRKTDNQMNSMHMH